MNGMGIPAAIQNQLSRNYNENAKAREATIGALACNTAEYIINSVNDFWSTIPNDYEVGMQLTTLGQGLQVYLNSIAYHDPHLIIFDSELPTGEKMRIVQHVTQLNYVLIALPLQKPEIPKRKIVFGKLKLQQMVTKNTAAKMA